jgi:ferrochelatase
VDEVAHHYEIFGGVSPLTALTKQQAEGLAARLRSTGPPLPVYVGMRNWHPFLRETLGAMSRDGIRHAIGFVAAAHRSYSSCTQYRENVAAARAEVAALGLPDVRVTYVGDWHVHAGFIEANAAQVRAALADLPDDLRSRARLVFTAHSIPVTMAERFPYRQQIEESARLVASMVGADEHAVVFQSRSGRPEDPWLGPDVCDYLREEARRGLPAAVLCPIGFLCDHIEVLYDLDVEASAVCAEIGLPMVRARTANDHPAFLDAMADIVRQTVDRYRRGTPLPIVPNTPPAVP